MSHESINILAWAAKTNTVMHVLNLNLNLSRINQNQNFAVLYFYENQPFQGVRGKKSISMKKGSAQV